MAGVAWRVTSVLIFLCISSIAVAQAIPPSEQPGRERERFAQPTPALARPAGPTITLPSTVAPAGAEAQKLLVREIHITGSTVYSQAELAPLYQGLLGHEISLQAIYDLAQRITAKYGEDGYVLSRAIIPPQSLNPMGSDVHIEVIEGYVDQVIWPPAIAGYRDFFSSYAAKITAARPANIHVIERYLLLASDLPGLKFSSSLRPSKDQPAASTLVVEVTQKPIEASVQVDNRGTRARGPVEYLGSTTFNNFLGNHEALTLTVAGAFPLHTLQFFDANYRQILSSEGLAAFVEASYGWGRPGTAPLEVLDYNTCSAELDAGLSYPLIRARERNLTLSSLLFLSDNDSNTLGAPFNRDRLRGFRLKADGDLADALGGINQLNVTFSQGIDGLGSTANGNPLASRAAGRVDFSKIEATVSRTQPLFENFSAYVSAYGQYAFTPLLEPEQCGYGGRYFGRAFDPSQFLGDSCFEASGELRFDVPTRPSWLTQAQVYGFSDYGRLFTLDAAPGTPANVEGASVGGGLRLAWSNAVSTDLQAAKGIDGHERDWRFFFSIAARY